MAIALAIISDCYFGEGKIPRKFVFIFSSVLGQRKGFGDVEALKKKIKSKKKEIEQ